MSSTSSPWLPAGTLLVRELTHFARQPNRILGTIGTPLLFWLLIGAGIGRSFAPGGEAGGGYLEYFFPGTVLLIVLFTAVFSTISIIEDRKAGFLQGVMVAPVPRSSIVMGKVLGGSAVAVGQGLLCLALTPLVGFDMDPLRFAGAVAVLALVAVELTTLGFLIAWRMESTQGFHAIMNLFLIPLWMLCGAFFPASGAAGWLEWVMRVNPLTYGMAAFRHCLYPAGQLEELGLPSPALSIGVTLAVTALLFAWAVRMTTRSPWHRS